MNKTNQDFNILTGNALKLAREKSEFTQQDMATASDMSKNHISLVEHGDRKLTVELLFAYCSMLHMTPDQILEHDPTLKEYLDLWRNDCLSE